MTAGLTFPCLTLEFVSDSATGSMVLQSGIHTRIALPRLAGRSSESLLKGDKTSVLESDGPYQLLRHRSQLAGVAVQPVRGNLQEVSHRLYARLFRILGDTHHPYRIWHYVPAINRQTDGLENYHIFNIGRRQAFAERFGATAEQQMPAASAVGVEGDHLIMAFVAGTALPRFLENPEQTPAYQYPGAYGPQPPSFARAATYQDEDGRHAYVSGTASIKGHDTVAADEVVRQFHITLDNLNLVAQRIGIDDWDAVTRLPNYRTKVYLRHVDDWPRVQALCREHLRTTEENSSVLKTEICRHNLRIEVEAAFDF